LNSKSCIANSGPLTAIPPTLLSPTSFLGSTLQKIKVEQHVIKSLTTTGASLTQYALDFIGPLMPYHIHRLCCLFRRTQFASDFQMVTNVVDQTVGFNCIKKNQNEMKTSDEMSIYLDQSEKESIENNYGIFGEAKFIKSINLKNNSFICNH
jgi:hypothetical protein